MSVNYPKTQGFDDMSQAQLEQWCDAFEEEFSGEGIRLVEPTKEHPIIYGNDDFPESYFIKEFYDGTKHLIKFEEIPDQYWASDSLKEHFVKDITNWSDKEVVSFLKKNSAL